MKIGIFYDQEIPYKGTRPNQNIVNKMSEYAQIIDLNNYTEKLKEQYDTLINLHGQYFIKETWGAIKNHLKQGGGLINIGDGSPFSKPLFYKDDQWVCEREQTAYHEEIKIFQTPVVNKDRISFLSVNEDIPVLKGFEDCFSIQDTVGYVVNFAKGKDTQDEMGSCGPIDAVLYPLLDGYMSASRKTAAPVIMIENTKGLYEGGRWIFINQETDANFWENEGVELLKKLSGYVATKGYEVEARTNYASFYPGEQPTVLLQLQSYREQQEILSLKIEIFKDDTQVFVKKIQVDINEEFQLISVPTDLKVEKGMYTLTTTICFGEAIDRVLHNGFWGYDKELLESGSSVTCDRYYFYKDGKPMPIIGMTYMQPDVHRKFIHRPNVYLWDKDFKTMQEADINMIRTGIWTSFKTIMPSDGFVSEEILRVFDAMFLTAKKYDIPIVFNFFAFAPEMWSGINPYLDPKSIQAQKRYINAVVSRHKNSKGVMWDLINEPSVSNPKRLWQTRPNGDHYEVALWRTWLKEKHGTIEKLQEKWNYSCDTIASFEGIDLPEEKDFAGNLTGLRHELKAHDYYLFTQEVFNQWAKKMYASIRALKADQLITVGQDEAAGGKRPHPFFTQEVMDYTCNHPWWQLDDLYWDTVFYKAPNKPNLSQETGIMNVNYPNGKGKLTEISMRNLLERKYAFAFAGDNAGSVQWVWNINIHIDSLNESTIGAVRPDGGQKLESDISYDFGGFMKEVAYLFKNRQDADVVVISPFANSFSSQDFSIASTQKVCQILGHDMSTSFNVYSDFHLDDLKPEKLIMLPSARTLTSEAFDKLLDCAHKGSVLYISGPFSYDEFWGKIEGRSKTLGMETTLMSVCQEESMVINDETYRAIFRNLKKNWVDKEVEEGNSSNDLKVIAYGAGKIIWSPLPLEMNEQSPVIQKAYEYAIELAGVAPDFTWMMENHHGIFGKNLKFEQGNLYIFVSELGHDKEITIKNNEQDMTYKFILPAQRIMMFGTDDFGNVVKTYKDWEVESNRI